MPRLVIMVMVTEPVVVAEGQQDKAWCLHQLDDRPGGGQRAERFCQRGFEGLADPENQISGLKLASLRGLKGKTVRGGCAIDQKRRASNTFHDRGRQRMNRLDGCHNRGSGKGRDAGCAEHSRETEEP